MENIGEKNPPGPTNICPPNLGGKVGLSTWITYLPHWCVICKFFLFFILFYFFILLWKLACLWLVSQVLDSLSFLPFFPFFFLKKKILLFCVRKTPFLFSIVLVFFFFFFEICFLGSWTSYPLFILFIFLMKKSFIHIFFNKNIMYYFCFT